MNHAEVTMTSDSITDTESEDDFYHTNDFNIESLLRSEIEILKTLTPAEKVAKIPFIREYIRLLSVNTEISSELLVISDYVENISQLLTD